MLESSAMNRPCDRRFQNLQKLGPHGPSLCPFHLNPSSPFYPLLFSCARPRGAFPTADKRCDSAWAATTPAFVRTNAQLAMTVPRRDGDRSAPAGLGQHVPGEYLDEVQFRPQRLNRRSGGVCNSTEDSREAGNAGVFHGDCLDQVSVEQRRTRLGGLNTVADGITTYPVEVVPLLIRLAPIAVDRPQSSQLTAIF